MRLKTVTQAFALCILLLGISLEASAQQIYSGVVIDKETKEPLIGANVVIGSGKQGCITNNNGEWQIECSKPTNKICISYVGYITSCFNPKGKQRGIHTELSLDAQMLESVEVLGKKEERILRESSMPISVISTRQLQGTASSIDEVLARTSGVTLRNAGGLGSASRISVRGLEGKRMGVYMDDQPMGELSNFLSISDIPTDMIERIEVYKGIVPYKFGGSAMGGAVNVVTKEYSPVYFDASYEVGSFNSHLVNSALKRSIKNLGLEFGIGGIFAYADNNYEMYLPAYENRKVRREHDQYKKYILGGSIKATKWWFDEIKLEYAATYIRQQMQGYEWDIKEAYNKSKNLALLLMLKRNDFFLTGLDLDYDGGVIFGRSGLVDTAMSRYDWDGNRYPPVSSLGGETGNFPSDADNRNFNVINRLNMNYTIDRHQAVNLNLYHSITRQDPRNKIMDQALGYKANFKSRMNSVTLGASYDVTLFEDKLQNAITLKYFNYRSDSKVVGTVSQGDLKDVQTNNNYYGWSEAIRYRFTPEFLIKASYADEVRIPSSEELLGNGYSISAATDLRPERSRGGNLGLLYRRVSYNGLLLEAEMNGFYTQLTDMIRYSQGVIPTMSQYSNFGKVRTWGVEAEVKWDALSWLYLYTNVTYQDLRDVRKIQSDSSLDNPTYMKRMPNIPYLMANAGFEFHKENLFGGRGQNSRLLLDAAYIHQYFYDFEVSNYQDRKIPSSLRLDLALEQSILNHKVTFTFKVKNLTNQRLMTEFNRPLPGINFAFKVRYLFR